MENVEPHTVDGECKADTVAMQPLDQTENTSTAVSIPNVASTNTDGNGNTNIYGAKKMVEGLMDIALLSANANQLRFLLSYNAQSPTYIISLLLVIMSLGMQVSVGISYILMGNMKQFLGLPFLKTSEYITGAVFIVTVINVLLTAFTITSNPDEHAK